MRPSTFNFWSDNWTSLASIAEGKSGGGASASIDGKGRPQATALIRPALRRIDEWPTSDATVRRRSGLVKDLAANDRFFGPVFRDRVAAFPLFVDVLLGFQSFDQRLESTLLRLHLAGRLR